MLTLDYTLSLLNLQEVIVKKGLYNKCWGLKKFTK